MNSKEIPKLNGKRLQLSPKARWVRRNGQFQELDGLWYVESATEDEVVMNYAEALAPTVTVKRDHIRNYSTGSDGKSDGFLVLLSRVLVDEFPGGYRVKPIHPILERAPTAIPSQAPESPIIQIGREAGRPRVQLTREEAEILISAADRGEITIHSSDQHGQWVCAGSRHFWDDKDRAILVRYLEALKSLCRRGLAAYDEGNLYTLTSAGFEIARNLVQRPS